MTFIGRDRVSRTAGGKRNEHVVSKQNEIYRFCICECRYIAIVRVPEVCKHAHSQSATAYRWNDVMIIISKWRFTEGWNKGKFVNLRLKLYIKRSQNNVILLVWIWQMSIVHFLQAFEGFHHLIRSGNEMIRNFWQENYWLMALRLLLWSYESNDSSTFCLCRCISSCKYWRLRTSQFNIFIDHFN
jgi:hypothetical protein